MRLHDSHFSPQALQPFGDLSGIGHATAQHQELRLGRGQGHRQFVVQAASLVPDHLVFVDHEQAGSLAGQESLALRLQGRHQDRRLEVLGEIPGCDPHFPTRRTPLPPLVVGQGPGGNGEDRLLAFLEGSGGDEVFKDEGLPGTGGGVNDDVRSLGQRSDRLLLPEIRQSQVHRPIVENLEAAVHGKDRKIPSTAPDGDSTRHSSLGLRPTRQESNSSVTLPEGSPARSRSPPLFDFLFLALDRSPQLGFFLAERRDQFL